MKFPFFIKKKSVSKPIDDNDNPELINFSSGYLFKGNLFMSRKQYLEKVANIVRDTNSIFRDGTKIKHEESFKKRRVSLRSNIESDVIPVIV